MRSGSISAIHTQAKQGLASDVGSGERSKGRQRRERSSLHPALELLAQAFSKQRPKRNKLNAMKLRQRGRASSVKYARGVTADTRDGWCHPLFVLVGQCADTQVERCGRLGKVSDDIKQPPTSLSSVE